uniref:L3 n=1 Tax=Rhipicephalus zambeziensis TaxID=60191 RepID=A0A224Z305_9ACAR
MCSQALRRLRYLQRALSSAPSNTRLLTYKTLVCPILEYGSVIWNPHKIADIRKIESVHKKAIRFICCHYGRYFPPSSLLHSLQLTSLSSRRQVESLKFFYNLIHSPRFSLLSNYITPAKPTSTGHHHKLNISPFHHQTDAYKQTFFVNTIELWNALPSHVRSISLIEFVWYTTIHLSSCSMHVVLFCNFLIRYLPSCNSLSGLQYIKINKIK